MKARLQRLIAQLLLSSPSTVLVMTHGWPLQAIRVVQGDLDDRAAALCQDMPGNCETVEGLFGDPAAT